MGRFNVTANGTFAPTVADAADPSRRTAALGARVAEYLGTQRNTFTFSFPLPAGGSESFTFNAFDFRSLMEWPESERPAALRTFFGGRNVDMQEFFLLLDDIMEARPDARNQDLRPDPGALSGSRSVGVFEDGADRVRYREAGTFVVNTVAIAAPDPRATDTGVSARASRAATRATTESASFEHAPEPSLLNALTPRQREAFSSIGLDPDDLFSMPYDEANQRITAAYAELYLRNPDVYLWAGMAAYASDQAGHAMADCAHIGVGTAVGGAVSPVAGGAAELGRRALGAPDPEELLMAFRIGNLSIFADMFWQHQLFDREGIAGIRRAAARGEIPSRCLSAWEQIERGRLARVAGDIELGDRLIAAGNRQLLREEQDVTIQDAVYSRMPRTFAWVASEANVLGVPTPIPGSDADFIRDMPGGDFGNALQRWTWIEREMLPAWLARQREHREDVADDMSRFRDRYPPAAAR